MDNRKYVFVGNRFYVLQEMIKRKLNIKKVYVMENSFLHRFLSKSHIINYVVISSKEQLLKELNQMKYDVLISNGCKYILPISSLPNAKYVNIHPSYLPDLKGRDPINGACLFGRTAGAACHLMDEGIDTGAIIARVPIDISIEIDAGLLFQLSFKAEVQAFSDAYEKDFLPLCDQPTKNNSIYYSISPKDCEIDFSKGPEHVVRQVKAFGYQSKGAYFECNGIKYKFFDASFINNKFIDELSNNAEDLEVFLCFENTIIFKLQKRIIRFNQIVYNSKKICEGDIICSIG